MVIKMGYDTILDDFLNLKNGSEIPPALQKPQALLKLPKGSMSIFIQDNKVVYRYDGKCYEGRREDAITNLVFLLRLRDYLEVAKQLKPKYISKAYEDDIFVIAVKEPTIKSMNIDEKMKFEGLRVKLEIYEEDFKIRDLSDFEPMIPNDIVEEAIDGKDFCFFCNLPLKSKIYCYDEEFGGMIICYNCFKETQDTEEVNEVEEPTEEQLRKYEERKEKMKDNLTKEQREQYFKEQWSSFWASLKEEAIGEQYVANEVEEAIEEKKEEKTKPEEPKILKIYFDNAKDFFEILRLLEVIDDYAGFTLNSNGLQYCQIDASHVSLISANFKAKYESIEECKFTIDLRDFTKGVSNEELRNMKNSSLELEIDLTNKKARIFTDIINIEGEILDEEVNDALEPKMVFDVEGEVDLKYLLNAIKGFETIKISVESDRLYVDARNEMVKKKSFIPSKLITFRNGTLAYYNVHYIEKFLKKAVRLTKTAKLSFSHNKPLCITFETKIAKISYWLAPKVEGE
ncbi:MAG: hypothetical protein QXP52_02645 [Candidatus Aenigmatarchaeota archaeon]